MDALHGWFQRQAARERRILFLEDALLSRRFWPYAVYRLRYFFAQFGTAAAAHVFLVFFLFRSFDGPAFVGILLAHAASGMLSGFWWGALEVMRDRVRDLYRTGRTHVVPKEIGRWLLLSIWLSAAVLAIATLITLIRIGYAGWRVEPDNLYVWTIFAGLSVTLVARCYHSGLYAIRRIYRPLVTIIAADVVGVLAILSLLPLLGPWSFAVAGLVTTLLICGFTFHYTGRLYDFFDFRPWDNTDFQRRRWPVHADLEDWVPAGLAYGVVRLDSLLVLTLFFASQRSTAAAALFMLFFLIGPAIRAGLKWAQLFYFDFARLDLRIFRNMRRRFERSVLRLAVVIGLIFWGAACLMGAVAYPGAMGSLYGPLLLFLLSRSVLAATQIEAFTEGAYRELILSGALLLTGFAVAMFAFQSEGQIVIGLSVSTLVALAFLWIRKRRGKIRRDRAVLGITEWLLRLRAIRGPVRVLAAEFDALTPASRNGNYSAWDERWRHLKVAEGLGAELGSCGEVALIHPGRVVWFDRRGAGDGGVDREWFVSYSAGLLRSLRGTRLHPDGRTALEAAHEADLLCGSSPEGMNRPDVPVRLSEIEHRFRHLFPEGVVYAPDQPVPDLLNGIGSRERRSVFYGALSFARWFEPNRGSDFDVTSFCVRGELRRIFIVAQAEKRERRVRWRSWIRQWNIWAPLVGVVDDSDKSLGEPTDAPATGKPIQGAPQLDPTTPREHAPGGLATMLGARANPASSPDGEGRRLC